MKNGPESRVPDDRMEPTARTQRWKKGLFWFVVILIPFLLFFWPNHR